MPPDIIVYHNPDCGTSRNTLAAIRHAGIRPHVIEYLKTPPERHLLRELIDRMGISVRDAMRERGTPFKDLGLDDPSLTDDALLDAMMAHPILINRPIVVAPSGVKLCRPSETVLDLLPGYPVGDLDKDDGTPFLIDERIEPGAALAEALSTSGLPLDDLGEPGRTFFRYRRLGGSIVGFGGFESYGEDVLLRSIVVEPAARGRGFGRSLTLLLMSRAFDAGARRAFLLTGTATAFFEGLGFRRTDRADAPPSILATRQASGLCSSNAPLLSRRITL